MEIGATREPPASCLLIPENKQSPIINPLFQTTRFQSPPGPSHPPCVIDLLDEGVVLLPEGHGGGCGVGLSAWPALALALPPGLRLRSYAESGIRDSPLWVRPRISHMCLQSKGKTLTFNHKLLIDFLP